MTALWLIQTLKFSMRPYNHWLHGWSDQNILVANCCRVWGIFISTTNSLVWSCLSQSINRLFLVCSVIVHAAQQYRFLYKQSWVFVRCSIDLYEFVLVQIFSKQTLVSWYLLNRFDVTCIQKPHFRLNFSIWIWIFWNLRQHWNCARLLCVEDWTFRLIQLFKRLSLSEARFLSWLCVSVSLSSCGYGWHIWVSYTIWIFPRKLSQSKFVFIGVVINFSIFFFLTIIVNFNCIEGGRSNMSSAWQISVFL